MKNIKMLPCKICDKMLPVFDSSTMKRITTRDMHQRNIDNNELYVELILDPFLEEIYDDHSLYWLCPVCCYEQMQEI